MKFDSRISLALLAALFFETAGALIWTGRSAARLDSVEQSARSQPELAQRLARIEAQMSDVQASLARIERKVDRR